MPALLSGVQFLSPWALMSALAVPLLVLAYLKRVERKRTTFSSVLILKLLSKKQSVQRKVKLPLRFFLELCALLALVLGGAWPVFESRSARVAIVVDNSLSMSAALRETSIARTRLEVAVAKAREIIEEIGSDSYALYLTAPRLTKLGEKLTVAACAAKLAQISVVPSGDNAAVVVGDIAESGEHDRVVLFTDQQAQFARLEDESVTTVEVVTVGDPVGNVYLTGLRLERDSIQVSQKMKLVASLGFSGVQPQAVSVKFRGLGKPVTDSLGELSAQPVVLGSLPVQVEPGRSAEVALEISAAEASYAPFSAEIEVGAPAASAGGIIDAVSADNSAWLAQDSGSGGTVLVVSPADARSDVFGLARIPGVHAEFLQPEQYSLLKAEELRRFSTVIFHRVSPGVLPAVPSLMILPPQANSIFPVRKEVSSPRLTSWAADHPLTSYLKVPLLQPTGAVVFDTPPWAQEVLNVEPGAILAAGELAGVRTAAIGFELFPFEGSATPGLSILTLNLLNWLSGGVELGSGVLTGGTLRLEGQPGWTISGPSGTVQMVQQAEGAQSVNVLVVEPGIWIARSQDASRVRTLAVNAFHPQESATYTTAVLQLEATYEKPTKNIEDLQPLWPYLIYLVLFVLTVELALRITSFPLVRT